ncbi:ORF2-like protein [Dinothrombium tinctorium]|uniref:ORF2-like protein n=1 Tax=Dinothrombium tinctorium TaxID=1965070 RepID=A0A3S3P0A9_9ACAR|nr:ORF2-like protein [Dinothrombium tinctorium]
MNNFFIANLPSPPTYQGPRGSSFIDVTLVSENAFHLISNWEVGDFESLSDHKYVNFEIFLSQTNSNIESTYRYNTNKAKWEEMKSEFAELCQSIDHHPCDLTSLNLYTEQLMFSISQICDRHIPRKRKGRGNSWWTTQLTEMRKQVNRLRRRYQRTSNEEIRQERFESFKEAKKAYQLAIKKAKEDSWIEFCSEEGESNPWNRLYKIIKKVDQDEIRTIQKEDGSYTANSQETAEYLLETFFTNDRTENDTPEISNIRLTPNTSDDVEMTEDEILNAASSFSKKKAPGFDGFTADISKFFIENFIKIFYNLFNACLKYGVFPGIWKRAMIKLIPKSKRNTAKAYRPIKGAFNNAWWPGILMELKNKRTPRNIFNVFKDFLNCRSVSINVGGSEASKMISKGCPQGSISGPILWTVLFNSLLEIKLPQACRIQAFADDSLLNITGASTQAIQKKANESLKMIAEWGLKNKLQFNALKTKAVLITKKRRFDSPRILMNGTTIEISQSFRYLGVIIESKFLYDQHIEYLISKLKGLLGQLYRCTRLKWGLGHKSLLLLYKSVVEPIIMYGSPIFYTAASKNKNLRKLRSLQRQFAMRIIKSFGTISYEASIILSNILPIDLRIQERVALFQLKNPQFLTNDIKMILQDAIINPLLFEKPTPVKNLQHPSFSIRKYPLNQSYQMSVYTDGSKNDIGVGSAFCVFQDDQMVDQESFRLSNHCSVFQSELFAILKAITYINRKENIFRCEIITDSKSALQALQNRKNDNFLINEIKNEFSRAYQAGHLVDIKWIPGHTGDLGNETTDFLARRHYEINEISYNLVGISFVKSKLRQRTLRLWEHRWQTTNKAITTKKFFPTVESRWNLKDIIACDYELTQCLSGHGKINHYLQRFHLADSSLCSCGIGEETIEHIILECERYSRHRRQLVLACDIKQISWPPQLSQLVGKDLFTTFLSFIHEINQFKL